MGAADEPKVVVYQATNLMNNKRYIGVTKRGLSVRRKQHLADARRGSGVPLHAAIRKYGCENIMFEVLVDFQDDFDLAKVYEWEMISKHRPEYNLPAGGDCGTAHPDTIAKIRAAHLGRKRSPEARANMSEAQRRRGREMPHSPETRAKMRLAKLGGKHRPESIAKMIGRKDSAETRARKSAAGVGRPPTKGRTGQPVPQETREKIRQSLKQAQWADTPARVASRARTGTAAAHEARKLPVRCVEDGKVFESVKAAALFYGLNPQKLAMYLREGWSYHGKRFERLPKPT